MQHPHSSRPGALDVSTLPIRRNTILLAVAMAVNSAMFQLSAAISALTFALVTGLTRLLGLGPALLILSAALTAYPMGRLMDRVGRVPVLAGGFLLGAIGTAMAGIGAHLASSALTITGFILTGAAGATAQLARAAASDMYPPAKRARGIAYVMFGAVFGAILGPSVFGPLFRGRSLTIEALAVPWLTASGMMLVATVIVLFIRPDPRRIAEALEREEGVVIPEGPVSLTPLREVLGREGVRPAMIAGIASFAVMVSVMNLTGYVVVQHRSHPQHLIFPIIGAHVLGMYLLMPAVGWIVDRVGRPRAIAGGLSLMAVSTAGLLWAEGVGSIAALLFGLGLGWNFSFVAATTQLADLALPSERGRLLGFNDLAAGLTGAVFVLAGGYVLTDFGLSALTLGAAVAALLPVLVSLRRIARPAVA